MSSEALAHTTRHFTRCDLLGERSEYLVTLAELASACSWYSRNTDYDNSYLRFTRITKGSPDLGNPKHRKELLTWLNKWNCRQFARKYHQNASREIFCWHNEYGATLPSKDKNLWELTEPELALVGAAYESLSTRTASYRTRNGKTSRVSVGPTGAAKILFAIRPRALLPWDKSIRKGLRYQDSKVGYLAYLRHVKAILDDLAVSCRKNGFQLADLPQHLGRPNSTVPKLIDEYYWVTIRTNK